MAAPTIRSSATTLKTTESTTYAVTLPPTVSNNDTLVIFTTVPVGTLVTPPVGWTTLDVTAQTTLFHCGVYVKIGAASDANGTASFTLSTSRRLAAVSVAVAGAKTTVTYIATAPGIAIGSNHTDQTTPSVTTPGDDCLILVASGNSISGQSFTPPTGYTELADIATSTGTRDAVKTVASKTQAIAGAAGAATFTSAVASAYIAQQIAIPSITTNIAPVADAGLGQVVAPGSLVSLDATASTDPDGSISSYSWTCISSDVVTLTNPTTAMPTFIAPSSPPGPLTFQLVVTDNQGRQSAPVVTGVIVEPPKTTTTLRSRISQQWQ